MYASRLNATGTYVANEYIQISNNTGDFRGLSPYELSTSDNWVMEADIMQTNDSNRQYKGFYILRTDDSSRWSWLIQYSNSHVFYVKDTGTIATSQSGSSINTWYHFKLQLENGVFYYEVTDTSDNVLFSHTWTLDSYYQNKTIRAYIFAYDSSNTVRFKNVSVSKL